MLAAAVALLAGCEAPTLLPPGLPPAPPPAPPVTAVVTPPAPQSEAAPAAVPAPAQPPAPTALAPREHAVIDDAEPRVRFVRDDDSALARVDETDWLAAWPAWLASCRALTAPGRWWRPAWQPSCDAALALHPARGGQVRDFFFRHMDSYRVLALDAGREAPSAAGLVTGYYEPEIEGRRRPGGAFTVPIYRLPSSVPGAPRAELEVSGRLRGLELLWLKDPVEAFFLEVQGSGRIRLEDGIWIRVAYAGSNGQPYRSIGRWLVEQGELSANQVSAPAIADWAHAHPLRVRELIDQDPRVIFFQERPPAESLGGPVGTLGVALTAGVSVAVDPRYLPLGAPLLLNVTAADSSADRSAGRALDTPLPPRIAMAQDTGAAIQGPLRIDWYLGQGSAAGETAGRVRTSATLRVLVPRGIAPERLL